MCHDVWHGGCTLYKEQRYRSRLPERPQLTTITDLKADDDTRVSSRRYRDMPDLTLTRGLRCQD